MKEIQLTRGLVALVDDDDFESLSKFSWAAQPMGKTHYAIRSSHAPHGHRKTIRMHREVLNLLPHQSVDHINRNGLDNRRENLRAATDSQNRMNTIKGPGCSSIYKGVFWRPDLGVWRARISVNKRTIYLGHFDSEVEAALAYDAAASEHYGEFALLNFPKKVS